MTSDGTVTAQVNANAANDAASNGNTISGTASVTRDTSTTVAITAWTNPVDNTNQTNVSVSGTAEAGDTIELKITDAGNAHTVGPFTTTATGGTWSFSNKDVSSLNDGTITYSVKATDAATNTATDSKTATKSTLKANDDPSMMVNANSSDNPLDVFSNDNPHNPTFSSVQKTGGSAVPGTLTTTTDQGGTATYCAACVSPGVQAIKYTPATDYVGPDGFDYTITDGAGHYSTAHVTISVQATGSLDSQMILEDSNINDLKGSFNVLFAKSPKPYDSTAVRLKNTEPGNLHLTARIFNHTNVNTGDCTGPPKDNTCTIDAANGNRVVAVLSIPDMPTNCGPGMKPYTTLGGSLAGDCSNPGGLGKPAFALQGGPDGKDAVHAHPDDKTDNMKILVQYLTYTQWQGQGSSCADNGSTPWSTTLPADGVVKCIKVSGIAIKVNHYAKIDVKVQFRPTDTDWPASANPALFFRAGFNFKLNKAITYDFGTPDAKTYTATDNIDTVGVGKKVTAVGGFIFKGAADSNPGANATGYSVRLYNSPSDAGASAIQPFGVCAALTPTTPTAIPWAYVDTDGFYFIQSTGYNDPNVASAQNLPSNVQYFVQVCDPLGNPIVASLVDHKLADKEFVEWDMNANPALPRPMSLAIKHQNGKPDNNDTVQVTWTEPLAEATMCSAWGWDNSKDQTLSGVTLRIVNNGAPSGNDQLVVQSVGSACGGVFHFGTVDLGSPNYVVATNADFTSSKIAWMHNGTLTFTLGGSATTTAVLDPITAVYMPDTAMTDTSGNAVPSNATASDPTTGGSQSNF
jgi:hypothetical protein